MAQVTLISESLNSIGLNSQSPWQLAQTLSQQGHDVTVITSQFENPPLDSRINVMRPFSKWSWTEAAFLLPRLISAPPEILILVQPPESSQRRLFHPVYFFLTALQHLPAIEVVCYLHQPLDAHASGSFLEFLRRADTIICAHHSILRELHRMVPPSGHGRRRVIPSDQDVTSPQIMSLSESEQESLAILSRFQSRVLAPLPLKQLQRSDTFLDFVQAADETLFVAFDGWRGMSKRERRAFQTRLHELGLQKRVFITGSGSDIFLHQIARLAGAILLAPFELSYAEHEFFHQLTLNSQTPALLTPDQQRQARELWIDCENCRVLRSQQVARHFAELISNTDKLPKINPERSQTLRLRNSDESVNLWSRLFAEPHEHYGK